MSESSQTYTPSRSCSPLQLTPHSSLDPPASPMLSHYTAPELISRPGKTWVPHPSFQPRPNLLERDMSPLVECRRKQGGEEFSAPTPLSVPSSFYIPPCPNKEQKYPYTNPFREETPVSG